MEFVGSALKLDKPTSLIPCYLSFRCYWASLHHTLITMRRGFLLRPKARIPASPDSSRDLNSKTSHADPVPTTSSDAIPYLPPELSDRIIDQLHDNLHALKSCSRVCRNWLPRSRFHYFRAVELTWSSGARFAALLSQNPGIGALVRIVSTFITDEEDENPKSLLQALPEIALKLPNVDKLTLRGYGEYTASPFRNFTNVRELRVHGCEISSLDDFVALICYLPKLETLSCVQALIGLTPIVKRPTSERPRPNIRRLEFHATRIDPTEFTQWLMSENMHKSVEEMSLRPLHVLALRPVGEFISAVGSSLKELDIALINTAILYSGIFGDLLGTQFSLASCTNIRKLVLYSTKGFLVRSSAQGESFSWGATMLSQVPLPTVQEVILWVSDADLDFIRSKEWETAMELIRGPRFSSLKSLLVKIWGSEKAVEDLQAVIRRGLRDLETNGVMRIEVQLGSPVASLVQNV